MCGIAGIVKCNPSTFDSSKAAFEILAYTISKQSNNGAISGSYPL